MDLFGTLSKDYCWYFYALSVAGFVLMILVVGSVILEIVNKRKVDWASLTKYIILTLGYFMYYLQNRILYSMCVKSL